MTPRVAKKDREDLPKPVVQQGSLGMFPVNPMTLSAMYLDEGEENSQSMSDALIGKKDEELTQYLKEHSKVKAKNKSKKAEIDLKGRCYNGLSDAFYRGKLPQVIIVQPNWDNLFDFVDEFMEHLEKLYSLGFFVGKINPVDELIPNFILATNGFYYNSLMTKLIESLENIEMIDKAAGLQILSKFMRGLITPIHPGCFEKGDTVNLITPKLSKIGGGSQPNQMITQTVLGAHGLTTAIESRTDNGAERLELENALERYEFAILPTLEKEKLLTKKDAKTLQKDLSQAILTIGKNIKAFEELETAELLQSKPDKDHETVVLPSDGSISLMLYKYAEMMGLTEAKSTFETLKEKVGQLTPEHSLV